MKRLPSVLEPLTSQPQWVIWKWRGDRKLPFQALRPHAYASTTDPSTWTTYARCRAVSANVGFVLRGAAIGALDLDDCRNATTAEIDSWAQDLIERAATYVEITPSQTGLRIIGHAVGGPIHRHRKMGRGKVEVYRDAERYITVTGNQVGDCKRLKNIDELIDALVPHGNGPTPPVSIDGRHYDWREVCQRLGCRSLLATVKSVVAQGKRSDVIWLIAKTLQAKGATPSEVAAVLRASKCWRDKHGHDENALRKEVARVFR
jgi:hypothetical protein